MLLETLRSQKKRGAKVFLQRCSTSLWLLNNSYFYSHARKGPARQLIMTVLRAKCHLQLLEYIFRTKIRRSRVPILKWERSIIFFYLLDIDSSSGSKGKERNGCSIDIYSVEWIFPKAKYVSWIRLLRVVVGQQGCGLSKEKQEDKLRIAWD